jgi:hypothetical protein
MAISNEQLSLDVWNLTPRLKIKLSTNFVKFYLTTCNWNVSVIYVEETSFVQKLLVAIIPTLVVQDWASGTGNFGSGNFVSYFSYIHLVLFSFLSSPSLRHFTSLLPFPLHFISVTIICWEGWHDVLESTSFVFPKIFTSAKMTLTPYQHYWPQT